MSAGAILTQGLGSFTVRSFILTQGLGQYDPVVVSTPRQDSGSAAGTGRNARYPVGDSRPKSAEKVVEAAKAFPVDYLTPFLIEMARLDDIKQKMLLEKENAILQRRLDILEDDEDFEAIMMSLPF